MSNLHDQLLRIGVTSGSRETDRVLECWGCQHFLRLAGAAGADWGVCAHPEGTADEPGSPNAGRLVFEHAGCGVWEQCEEPERPQSHEPDALTKERTETMKSETTITVYFNGRPLVVDALTVQLQPPAPTNQGAAGSGARSQLKEGPET